MYIFVISYILMFFIIINIHIIQLKLIFLKYSNLNSIEIYRDIFFVSCYYDDRFKALRLILYNNNNSKLAENISCTVVYRNFINRCTMNILYHLSEDNTVMNILIYIQNKPIKILFNHKTIYLTNIIFEEKKVKYKINVCIAKMVNYTAQNMLIQMIEGYRLFGVDHFTIYKTSCSSQIDQVLQYYTLKGIVEIIKWENNFDVEYAKYKTYGQRVKLNDCLYRNYFTADSILMTDLDEILWPVKENSIINMIKNIEKENNKTYDTYIFQEKIFKRNYLPYFDRYIHSIEDCDIFSYKICCSYTWKWPKLYIRNLTKITAVSIHWITGKLYNYSEIKVNSNIGFIRHTRRIYPFILKGLLGNWSFCRSDEREEIIKIKSNSIKHIITKL